MRKHFISAALMLLLMFFISPSAGADGTYYPGPGDIEAGTELNHLIASVPSGSEILSSGALPDGISLRWTDDGRETYVYISGTPLRAGTYSCLININGKNDLLLTLHVSPSRPSVSISGGSSCIAGESLKLEVSVEIRDGGSLSYRWYKSSSADGGSGEPVPGAESPVLSPDTSVPGTYYYYCEVTNTNNGESISALSAVSTLSVRKSHIDSISLNTPPSRLEYKPGEKFSPEGLSILVKYADGSSEIIKKDFELDIPAMDKPGQYKANVSYEGFSCSFELTVTEAEEKIEGIGIHSMPLKTSYLTGEELSLEGFAIRVYTPSGHRDIINGFICSPMLLETPGTQEILVSYGGRTCTFKVSVSESEYPVAVDILTLPHKLSYNVGEELQSEGISLKLIMNTGRTEALHSDFLCSPIRFDTPGEHEVNVSYKDLSCSFTIEVKAPSETPSPSAESPEPASVTPSPLPAEPEVPEQESHPSFIAYVAAGAVALAAIVVAGYSLSRSGRNIFKKRGRK